MSGTMVTRHAAPLREQVADAIRTEIIDGALAPGERLYEKALCDRYAVSRTVIREVLRQLESEALVTVRPGHGPMVTVLTPADIEALYEVRQELEGLAAEFFARRATAEQAREMLELVSGMEQRYLHGTLESRGESKNEFYRLLLDGAGNPVLTSQLAGIHARIGIFRHFSFVDPVRVSISYPEIVAIANAAARDRNPGAARALSVRHIEHASQLAVLEYTKRFSGTGLVDGATHGLREQD
ncbi:Transcriptional regulator, GntR family [Leucobacter sp. 7(1)]|uniref:GntR family transcriptional regulator n=1 Tax=Leucobacter sp. 7(1) TaxID=1255613 RepID=UPI00097F2235|nr:GntR family transcriptional regulator [Leucobacter sp. 7(1)]SJN09664.1 Transcriptional regulator, GntR family [Leucobacter sp. 7(1)]